MKEQPCSRAGGEHLSKRASESPNVILLRVILILAMILPNLAAPEARAQAAASSAAPQKAGGEQKENRSPSLSQPEEAVGVATHSEESAGETDEAALNMTLRFDPPYVPSNGKVILSWQLDNAKTIADTQLTMDLPADMVPEGIAASYYNPETRKLTMNLAGTSGQIPLAVALLYVWLISVGGRTIRDGLRHLVDRVDRRDLSIFQIGLRFIERSLTNALSFRIPLSSYLS
jgi:hypothetical protein